MSRAGRPFAALVLGALTANRITSTDAARYLDLKFEHFEKLAAQLLHGWGDAADAGAVGGGVVGRQF